jgi:hypothetical protein
MKMIRLEGKNRSSTMSDQVQLWKFRFRPAVFLMQYTLNTIFVWMGQEMGISAVQINGEKSSYQDF